MSKCPECGIDLSDWSAVRFFEVSDARMLDDGTLAVAERMKQAYATCANCETVLPTAKVATDSDFYTEDYEAYFAGNPERG